MKERVTWSEFPWAKAIITLLGAISTLFGIIINQYSIREDTDTERIGNLRGMVKTRDSIISLKDKQILDCKDDATDYFKKQDSTNRSMLNEPAKNLLKQLKK